MHIKKYIKNFILLCAVALYSNYTAADEIAITVDDLPAIGTNLTSKQLEINKKILRALKKFQAPATGFVNEARLYQNNKLQGKEYILKLWLKMGHQLGNHTFSHHALSRSNLAEYQQDVLKGEIVTRQIMRDAGQQLVYFRHPYLDTGNSKAMRDDFENFLKKHNYIIAPVTIENDDWKFNHQLIKFPEQQQQIIVQYLQHTKQKFIFYQEAAEKIFGRNIKHIWLLHANLLNALTMEELLLMLQELNYSVVTLEQALTEPAYQEPDHCYAACGGSWLYRWDYTRGKVVDWHLEPSVKYQN